MRPQFWHASLGDMYLNEFESFYKKNSSEFRAAFLVRRSFFREPYFFVFFSVKTTNLMDSVPVVPIRSPLDHVTTENPRHRWRADDMLNPTHCSRPKDHYSSLSCDEFIFPVRILQLRQFPHFLSHKTLDYQ